MIRTITIALALLSVSTTASAQYFEDPYLYYSVGGGKATTRSHLSPDIRFNFTAPGSGFACGNFNPRLDVQSMLGGIGNSIADLGSLQNIVTGALPGQILCRAQPSLCQLLQHYSVRAEDSWRFSVDACELMQQSASTGSNTAQDWLALRRAQEWQRQQASGADAATAHREVSEQNDPCVTWVEGVEAGCPGKPPVKPVRDTVRAGWCAANSERADCTSGSQATELNAVWNSPSAAAAYTADIVGDSEITSGGTPGSHTASGLQPKIEEEKRNVLQTLHTVLASGRYPTIAESQQLSSPSVSVNHHLINALREVDEHGLYAERLAEEIALARVIDKALLARRLLLTGSSEPNIQAAGPANEAVTDAVKRLEDEIDRSLFDFQTRRALVTSTSIELLNAHQRIRYPTSIPGAAGLAVPPR